MLKHPARIAKVLALVVIALVIILVVACDGSSDDDAEGTNKQVRGFVQEIVGRSITELESLSIRDESGKIWLFEAESGFLGFTASHLREHQLLGETVLVTFVSRGAALVAVEVED